MLVFISSSVVVPGDCVSNCSSKVSYYSFIGVFFFFQAEDGIRDLTVTGVQTCALPICYFYRSAGGTFAISTPINGEAACHGNGATIGFATQSPEQADAAHAAAVAAGGVTCEDPPGWREASPGGRLYLAYEIGRASCRER